MLKVKKKKIDVENLFYNSVYGRREKRLILSYALTIATKRERQDLGVTSMINDKSSSKSYVFLYFF